ncbi:MAG: DNA gyrase inhibitor YacG [Proteobacteria bacterium]|nr:DNA gyrase inhibitor YacG [Pseudomonadota bacterium]
MSRRSSAGQGQYPHRDQQASQYCEEFVFHNSAYRPFCSERCKIIDLGEWLDESYKVLDPNEESDFLEMDGDEEQQNSDAIIIGQFAPTGESE